MEDRPFEEVVRERHVAELIDGEVPGDLVLHRAADGDEKRDGEHGPGGERERPEPDGATSAPCGR